MWMEFSILGRGGMGRSWWRSNGERGRQREEGRKGGDTYLFRRRKVRNTYHQKKKKKKIINTFKARAKAKNLIFHKEKKITFLPVNLLSSQPDKLPNFALSSPSSHPCHRSICNLDFLFSCPSHTHTTLHHYHRQNMQILHRKTF